jgi:hypothetical protein
MPRCQTHFWTTTDGQKRQYGGHPFRHLFRWLGTMWRRFAPLSQESRIGAALAAPEKRLISVDRVC